VEDRCYEPWYPLFEAGIDREGCEALIREAGLPPPPKSACTFCPNNQLEEWVRLRERHPDRFAYAVAMSRRAEATVQNDRVVGLMRCNPRGKRQLHVWADGGYPDLPAPRAANDDDTMPCECAL
jgi:hypothetical protein